MSEIIRIIIVDDEAPARRLLKELLANHSFIKIIGEVDNGNDAINLITKLKPDGIFLDLQLPDMLGFDILKELDIQPFVIFTTAYDKYALKAFDSLSVDYILKPFDEKRLLRALNRLQFYFTRSHERNRLLDFEKITQSLQNTRIKTLTIKKGNKFSLIQQKDIYLLKAYDRYSYVFTLHGQKIFCEYMFSTLKQKLSDDFLRIQKSFIINKNLVQEIHRYSNNRFTIVMKDKDFTHVVSGPTYYDIIKEAFDV